MSYLTAYGALIQNKQFSKGDFVLLTAASSSMGLAAINVAKAEGAKVIATTRTQTKKEELLGLGADYVIVMQDEDLVARVKEITGGIGAPVVLDPIAGKGLPALAQATATGGTIIVAGYLGADMFGYVDGQPTPFPFIDTVGRNLNVRGYNAQSLMRDPAAVAVAKRYVYDLFARGGVAPKIDKVFPLSHIEDAYEYLNGNSQIGKIVVVP